MRANKPCKASKTAGKFVALSLIAALNLYAATDSNTTVLEKTIISTSGFETSLKDEIKNVTVITSDEIQERGYTSVSEVLQRAPSVSLNHMGIDMRGRGSAAKTDVKVMVNGVTLNVLRAAHSTAETPLDLIDVEDIERIEVIPGGGSVLYGNGTAGGLIHIITKQRPNKFHANISSKFGSYSYKDLAFGVGGKVADNLYIKFAGKGYDTKSYRREEKTKGKYFSNTINFQITDTQNLVINQSYTNTKFSGATNGLSKAQLEQDRRQPGKTKFAPSKDKIYNISIDYGVKFSEAFDMHFVPYYMKFQRKTLEKKGSTLFVDTKFGTDIKGRYKYENGELVAGYDFSNVKDKLSDGYSRLAKKTNSFYVLERHNFTDYLSLTAGYRFERADYDVMRPNLYRRGALAVKAFNSKQKTTGHAFEIMPNFKYSDTGSIYFKFENGYISPSSQQLSDRVFTGGRLEYQLNSIKPESFKTYEIGLKDVIFDQFFSVTLFWTDTKDKIIAQFLPNSQIVYKNAEKARNRGVELYAEQNLFDSLKLSQSYSYVDAKDLSEGEKTPLPYVSKQKFVLGADYAPIRPLTLSLDFKAYSSAYNSYAQKMAKRQLLDLSAKYNATKNFIISAGVKNLLNKKYSLYEVHPNKSLPNGYYQPAAERNFFVEFKYKY